MLAQLLKEARKAAGITQDQLTRATGISADRIGRIEQGTGKLSLEELESLLQIIDAKALIISKEQQEYFKQLFE